ncbi:MAG: rhomboid family intramembrane serine protease [Bacteroidales bacterium]|nr:rhomboid family intramembrane serine protease [Bacteroidales bacterium]
MSKALIISFSIVILMWLSFLSDWCLPGDFATVGIMPRTISGLKGILLSPFIHGSWQHLISNTGAIFALTFTLFWCYDKVAWKVWIESVLFDGLLVWLLARTSYHIGMSGVIFALLGFLLAIGIFRFSFKTLIISGVIFFLYGGALWGVLPSDPHISWEAHLFGFLAGIFIAKINKEQIE